ncbi:oligosaccharide repeat unit polymerase [Photobacterium kishitanii]|uniref:O-antigen polymerase n=1 Tax=Photobacterium kishitanii TaxID=318456 RepID=UPI000D1620A8|nr:O-antigen polymerase [Photobacterium kishitanii]PSU85464.1 oligosaccharide repeat unit polymerase [Photobacterium kishitanii]
MEINKNSNGQNIGLKINGYVCIYISLLIIVAFSTYFSGYNEWINAIFFIVSVATFCLVYFLRSSAFSLGVVYSFIFSLILGIPSLYMMIKGGFEDKFYYVLVMVLLVNIILYIISPYIGRVKSNNKMLLTPLFYVVFVISALCQLLKIAMYLKFIIASGDGHLAIYTESAKLHQSVPSIVRLISSLSYITSLMVFFFPSNKYSKILAVVVLSSDLLIGIRNKFFFSMLSILILYAYQNKKLAVSIFTKITNIRPVFIVFIVFSAISYFREGYSINFFNYILVVLDSLASTLSGLNKLFVVSHDTFSFIHYFDIKNIFLQLQNLVGFGGEAVQVSQTYSNLALGTRTGGINLSSSSVLESILLGHEYFFIILFVYSVGVILLISKLLSSNKIYLILIGMCMLPGLFFSTRAELVQVFVVIIKSLPIIIISPYLIREIKRSK